jgi:hypothetical protein
MTFVRIKQVEPLPGYRLRLTLSNGKVVERDVGKYLVGPVFEAIRTDPATFAQVRVEHGTVVWPGEIDLCPDVLINDGPAPESCQGTEADRPAPTGNFPRRTRGPTMTQRILSVRVRPSRVAVLINRTAGQDDLLLALKFLSRLWGGRFCQLLAVEPSDGDPVAALRLSQSRPDFVYGIGIDHAVWDARVLEACQPRGYGPLQSKYVDNLHDSTEEHITAGHVIYHLRQTPVGPGRRERPLRLMGCDPKSPLLPFAAALVGVHYEKFGSALPNEEMWLAETASAKDLLSVHTKIVSDYARSWLDLTSYGLSSRLVGWADTPPTIVLVDALVPDLALFWNLRMAADSDIPAWVIPLPVASATDPGVLTGLREWLLAFETYRRRPNFCRITSVSVPQTTLADFANRLQTELSGTHIKYVDPWEATNRLPVVLAFEAEEQTAVELAGQRLRFLPPRPKLLEGISSGAWMVDLVEDVRTKRSVKELCLPPRASTFAVLNTPGPLTIHLTRIQRLGDGVDGVSVRCSERTGITSIYLPKAVEILEEILREAGICPEADEKRACYLPVMRLFGGLEKAAQAFSGQRGSVLRALTAGTLQIGDIQRQARLGRGKLPELAQPQFPEGFASRLDPVSRRVLQQRSRERWSRLSPSTTEIESLVEFWADKGIVSRQWKLGRCPACMRIFWKLRLDITRPISCPGCGSRLRLPSQVPIGYSLHQLVGHAIQQGIVPVVLAGRFLRRLTSSGFFWMPGVKFKWGDKASDLDILACCDGHIVVGECKTLDGTPPETGIWEPILQQFARTIEVGKACRAAFAVLAVMAESFPPDFQGKADTLAGPSMKCLLLNKQDLEAGERRLVDTGDDLPRWLSLRDLIVEPMPENPRVRLQEPREIHTPVFSISY